MRWRHSVIGKKAVRYGAVPLRWLATRGLRPEDYGRRPPMIANAIPKSGTHLLVQVLNGLEGGRDWGEFLASTPSFSFKEIPPGRMAARIGRLAPGELAAAHLFHSREAEVAIRKVNALHYLIYRDPRDVVLSEAHYLRSGNRWHRLHRHFRMAPSLDDCISLAINGVPGVPAYPNVGVRLRRFLEWFDTETCLIRYEDLNGEDREAEVRRIAVYRAERYGNQSSVEKIARRALANIRPEDSHTFREGRIGEWREAFKPRHVIQMRKAAGELLVRMGYEASLEWGA